MDVGDQLGAVLHHQVDLLGAHLTLFLVDDNEHKITTAESL